MYLAGKAGRGGHHGIHPGPGEEGRGLVAGILGTETLENDEGTLRDCSFANVRLPLDYDDLVAGGDLARAVKIAQWVSATLVNEYDTFVAVIFHAGAWWVRLSAQVYLDMSDWTWCGNTLKDVCERAQKGEALLE